MCFFPDGRFHCFGCGADGDAADLYSALHGVSLAEALRVCRGERYTPKTKVVSASDLRKKLDAWKGEKWASACKDLHEAEAALADGNGDAWSAVEKLATAKDTLNLLESADMAQLLKMCAEDK